MKKALIAAAASFLLAIIFITLFFISVFNPREWALFFFSTFIGLSMSLAGFSLLFFSRRILRWQLDTSDTHEWILKILGFTDDEIASKNSIYFPQSPRGFRFTSIMWRIAGFLPAVLGVSLFLIGVFGLVGYAMIYG